MKQTPSRSRQSEEARDSSLRRTERFYVRLLVGALLGLVLFVGFCWAGYDFYARWQEHHLIHEARVALAKNDTRWAIIAAQRAYSWRTDSAEACRILAEIGDRQSDEQAIDWRRRALALAPRSVPDLIALADTALHFGRMELAKSTLARVPPAGQNSAAYQSGAARVALATGDSKSAFQHLTEAARLAPNDLEAQLQVAKFELQSNDPKLEEKGRAAAERLKENPKAKIGATELLLDAAIRSRQSGRAVDLARQLESIPGVPFTGRLQALSAYRIFDDPGFVPLLTQLQNEAVDSTEKAAALLNWMNSNGLALVGIDWSKQFPEKLRNTLQMRTALADSYVLVRDWKRLAEMLQEGSWQSAEALRLALKAKVARETGDEGGFEKNWAAAVEKASSERTRLELLQRLAVQWNWTDQAVEVLWILAKKPQTQLNALQALYAHYRETGDTAGLLRTLTRLAAILPEDKAVQNNLALLSLLLNVDSAKATTSARTLYDKNPNNAAFASTYAFALYQLGQISPALAVMRSLPPEQLQDPSVAAYYAIILAANDEKEDAEHYLSLASRAKLLPEEETLVDRAKQRVEAH